MPTTLVRREADRTAWEAQRNSFVGGSEVAAILGVSPFQTAVDIWLRKTGRAAKQPETEAMRLGRELEPYVAKRFAEESGRWVNEYPFILVNSDSHIGGDLDRLTAQAGCETHSRNGEINGNAAVLECKTAGAPWEGDEVPAHYQAQVQVYLGLTGLEVADVACLFRAPRVEFKPYRVVRDSSLIDGIFSACREWWERHIEQDEPPPPKTEADCRTLWASSKGVEVAATEDVAAAVARIREIESEIKILEADEETARAVVMAAMGEADTLVGADGAKLCTWKSNKPRSVADYKAAFTALAALHGMDANAAAGFLTQHTETKPGARVFRLAAAKR